MMENIESLIATVAASKGLPAPTVTEETILLGGELPIDSLDLAGMLVELQALTGQDPFRAGFQDFRTVGQLAALYSCQA